jgi:hypothetical protein
MTWLSLVCLFRCREWLPINVILINYSIFEQLIIIKIIMIIIIDLKLRFFSITEHFYIIEMQSINYNTFV